MQQPPQKHGTGQSGKEAIQKPERSLPGWLRQAGTYIPTGGLYAG